MQRHSNLLELSGDMINLNQDFVLSEANLINFISLTSDDKEVVHQWRNHPDVRKWMRTDHIIEYEEHQSFIERLRNDEVNFYWLVKSENQNIGVVYLTGVNSKEKTAYSGVYANPQLRGVGQKLMSSLQELSFDLCKFSSLNLEVMELNQRAISFYKNAGFIQKDQACQSICKEGTSYKVIMMEMINNKEDCESE
jgi:UDP-4-amino-4,6-dideoxy-N-acetyl-beta-L-altrosamine N-acetyltransferase